MSAPLRAVGFLALLLALACVCTVFAALAARDDAATARRAAVVSELELSDLSLWYEAMYTRHISQTDRFAPFADFPGALEHFPSGSLAPPPKDPDAPEGTEGAGP